jgi:hypothetical protein
MGSDLREVKPGKSWRHPCKSLSREKHKISWRAPESALRDPIRSSPYTAVDPQRVVHGFGDRRAAHSHLHRPAAAFIQYGSREFMCFCLLHIQKTFQGSNQGKRI